MEILRTARLTLRTWTAEDLGAAISIWSDREVMKYVDFGEAQPVEQINLSLEAGIRHQNKFGYQHWAVIENETQSIIGACGFNNLGEPDKIELVFHFSKPSWGKGFATEAAQGCIEYARTHIRPNKIVAGCHPENKASIRILQKVGFQYLGRKWFEDTKRNEPYFELSISYS